MKYEHYMAFVRRKRGQVQLVHSRRESGRVRQDLLYSFASPAELAATLEPGAWSAWKRTLAWKHPDTRWRWDRIRERLGEALVAWRESPEGAAVRDAERTAALVADLRRALASRSASGAVDAELLERIRPDLERLAGTIRRLVDPPAGTLNPGGVMQIEPTPDPRSERAEEVFWDGMEAWWAGDRSGARRRFRAALKLEPLHPSAHLHLAVDYMDRGRLKQAETHLELALEGGKADLHWDDGLLEWGWTENRPYLRALANLALVHRRRRRWREALEIHLRLLELNPNDNQGIRHLVGEELHRLGELEEAIEAYERGCDEPGCRFGLALALLQTGRPGRAALELVGGFGANRYVAIMLLGRSWQRLDGYWGSNLAEPDWASAYVAQCGDLWRSEPAAARFLERWWSAEPVQAWLQEIAGLAGELGELALGDERTLAVHRWRLLFEEGPVRRVVEAVEPGAAEVPVGGFPRPRVAELDEVSIERSGETAIIHFGEPGAQIVHFALGPDLASLDDREVLALHNEGVRARLAAREEFDYVAVELPPGRPQVERDAYGRLRMRGDVLRACIEDTGPDLSAELVVDGRRLSLADLAGMLAVYSGWGVRITVVPDDELLEPPRVRVFEPDDEVH